MSSRKYISDCGSALVSGSAWVPPWTTGNVAAPAAVFYGSESVAADCSRPSICVTSLNMRKWMRDRLQRRKKKAPGEQASPAAPPLQPAYFDAEQAHEQVPEAVTNEAEIS